MAIAAAAVNTFRTITKVVGVTTDIVYEAPVGFVGVVLLAQCSNINSNTETLSCYHNRIVGVSTVTTEIVKNFPISAYDTANIVTGRLVLETGDFISISGSSSNVKLLLSILETSNQ